MVYEIVGSPAVDQRSGCLYWRARMWSDSTARDGRQPRENEWVSNQPATCQRVKTNAEGHWELLDGTFVDVSDIDDIDADTRLVRSNLAIHTVEVDLPRHIRRHIRTWWDRAEAGNHAMQFAPDPNITPAQADSRGVLTQEVLAMSGEVKESIDANGGVRDVPVMETA